ncbi:PD40 domain-containing protein [Chthonomonas calidirosea]|uniref:PD40 domain-containing protein n=1 Tax=Chthonomonas calidirosea TaxID=454171 RepID=UPI000ACE4E5F|nr:PD40 domain-containing protein [Chthonomonas calidirosea]
MSNPNPSQNSVPDWWERENRRRQQLLLGLLSLILVLIGFYYYVAASGKTGIINGVDFDTTNYIAFIRQEPNGDTDLYGIRADGTGLRPLTVASDHSLKSNPTWTLDGKHILYVSNRSNVSCTQIYLLGAGQTPVQITYGSFPKDKPLACPDGKHVAFLTEGAIKTVYLNGNDVEQILPPPIASNSPTNGEIAPTLDPQGPYIQEAFSSDGSIIAGVQALTAQGNGDIPMLGGSDEMARALPNGAKTAYVLDPGRYVNVAWIPHTHQLLVAYAQQYVRDPRTQKSIYVGGINLYDFSKPGKPSPKPLMICFGHTLMPRHLTVSPDGKLLAFEGWMFKGDDSWTPLGIYVIRLPDEVLAIHEGVKVPPATIPATPDGLPLDPQWSPDGSRLLYEVQHADGKHDLWVVNADMTNPINLTKGVGDNTQAAWSPITK